MTNKLRKVTENIMSIIVLCLGCSYTAGSEKYNITNTIASKKVMELPKNGGDPCAQLFKSSFGLFVNFVFHVLIRICFNIDASW